MPSLKLGSPSLDCLLICLLPYLHTCILAYMQDIWQDMAETWLRYVQDIAEICQRYG